MKHLLKMALWILTTLLLSHGLKAQQSEPIKIDEDHYLIPLKDSIFIHVSYQVLEEYGRIPANGLLIIKNGQAIMVDTPWNNQKTEVLTSFLKKKMDVQVKKLIIGHAHEDCMGGLEYLQSIGVESLAHDKTTKKCKILSLPIPDFSFQESIQFDFNGKAIICRYFGGGHTIDNITIYLPDNKILFGGCLIKEMAAQKLGYTGDAVMEDWALTVEKIMTAYPNMEWVVPGHGAYGGKDLLYHTIQLVQQETDKKQ